MKSRKQMYIEAALYTAEQYENNTHEFNIPSCAYCKVTSLITGMHVNQIFQNSHIPCPLFYEYSYRKGDYKACFDYKSYQNAKKEILNKDVTSQDNAIIRAQFHRKVASELESWPEAWSEINSERTQIIEDVI